jgi:HK97 family phage prohead protease
MGQPHLKTVDFAHLKAFGDTRIIEGFASITGVKDLHNEIIEAGAFKGALKRGGAGVVMLWQHDTTQPIGISLEMEEQSKGLWFRSQLANTRLADEVLELTAAKIVTGISIGFDIVKESWDGDPYGDKWMDAVRHIKKVKLWEHSVVTFPAAVGARVQHVQKLWTPPRMGWPELGSRTKAEEPADQVEGVTDLITAAMESAQGNEDELMTAMMDEAGIDATALDEILNGSNPCPTASVVRGLARGLGIDEDELVTAGAAKGCPYTPTKSAGDEMFKTLSDEDRETLKNAMGLMQSALDDGDSGSKGAKPDATKADDTTFAVKLDSNNELGNWLDNRTGGNADA